MSIVIKTWNENIRNLHKNHKSKLVDEKKWIKRKQICSTCEFYEQYTHNHEAFRCKKCGCIGIKFMVNSNKCPLKTPKWN
jgi:hypothetical protein